MKVAKLYIRDFLSVGEAVLELADVGLVLIQGQNHDNPSAKSNGAGKSTLIDALLWVLYGETARGVSGDDVIRQGQKIAVVKATLIDEDSGRIFEVQRSRMRGKGKLHLHEAVSTATRVAADLTLGTDKLTQDAVMLMLGCSREVFQAAICLAQENMPDLPAMTDRNLKRLIEEAAGVDLLERAHTVARDRYTAHKALVSTATLRHHSLMGSVTATKATIASTQDAETIWLDDQATRIVALGEEISELEHQEALLLVTVLPEPKRERVKATLDGVKARFAGIHTEQKILRAKQTVVREAAGKHLSAKTVDHSAWLRLEAAKSRHAATLGATACLACNQALPAKAHAHSCEQTLEAVQEIEPELIVTREALLTAEAELQAAEAEVQTYEASMSDPTMLSDVRAKLSEVLVEDDKTWIAIKTVKANRETLIRQRSELDVGVSPYVGLLAASAKTLAEQTAELDAHTKRMAELTTETEIKEAVAKVLGPAGLRAHVLDQVTPYLNEQTARYLDGLSDGTLKAVWNTLSRTAKGEVRERFNIEVTHPAGEGFGALSGGEKRKVRVACALALQDLVSSRAGKPFKLFIADEIDDALDEAGLERLMTVLQEKARERGTVLVISHSNLTDWIPTTWTVSKRSGVSEVIV